MVLMNNFTAKSVSMKSKIVVHSRSILFMLVFVYIIVAKIELFESGAYLHSKLTKEQLYNICACTSFKRINYLNIVIHQTIFFDAIHIENNK
jgi:hypothetical protein